VRAAAGSGSGIEKAGRVSAAKLPWAVVTPALIAWPAALLSSGTNGEVVYRESTPCR